MARQSISVRGATFDKLKARCKELDVKVGTKTDELITKHLDQLETKEEPCKQK